MKKIILLILLCFNLIPCLKKGKLSLNGSEIVFAQYGNETGENPDVRVCTANDTQEVKDWNGNIITTFYYTYEWGSFDNCDNPAPGYGTITVSYGGNTYYDMVLNEDIHHTVSSTNWWLDFLNSLNN